MRAKSLLQSIALLAQRETRDGRSGIVTYRRTAEYQARGLEGAPERKLIRAEGLSAQAQSAGRQQVLRETEPVLQGSSSSGWTCYGWGYAGTETQRCAAERWRSALYDGAFDFEPELSLGSLAAMQRDGRWCLEVGGGLGDFTP